MGRSPVSRKTIVVIIALIVGLLHFVTGPGYRGPFPTFVNGYLIDILLPCAMYLVLGLVQGSISRSRIGRAFFVFTVGAVAETLQFFNIPIFGKTFDPLDYLMYGIGVLLGMAFEGIVLSRIPVAVTPDE